MKILMMLHVLILSIKKSLKIDFTSKSEYIIFIIFLFSKNVLFLFALSTNKIVFAYRFFTHSFVVVFAVNSLINYNLFTKTIFCLFPISITYYLYLHRIYIFYSHLVLFCFCLLHFCFSTSNCQLSFFFLSEKPK